MIKQLSLTVLFVHKRTLSSEYTVTFVVAKRAIKTMSKSFLGSGFLR